MIKHVFLLLIIFFSFIGVNAQLKVGNNPQTINPASMLEVESNSKGFLPPRLTTAQITAISNPPSGLIVYNTTVKCLQINVGTSSSPDWQCLVVVDATAPNAPVLNPSNGTSISGSAEPNSTVLIDTNGDGTAEYTTTANGSGVFTQAISPALANGTVVSVRARDAAGNTSAPATVTVDAVAPNAPVLNPSNGTSISGTAEPNSTVLIDTNGDGTPEYTTTADGSGNFTQPISPALANGTVVSVRARDAAGNTSAPATVTVDATAPAAPVLNPSNGTSISGTAEPNSTVLIDTNGDGTAEYTTTANGSGVFTQAISPALANGTVVSVRARDAAGNTSAPATVTVDATAPAAPVLNPSNGTSISGTAEPNSTVLIDTNGDGTPDYTTTANGSGLFTQAMSPALANGTVVSVRARDAAGNTSAPATVTVDATAPAAPVLNPSNGTSISGSAEPNSTVLIDTNGDGTAEYTTTANGSGVFTQAISPALANGTVVTVRARDAAGNTSAPATVTVDATAPAAPVLNPSNGTSISGTAEPNSTVLIDTNGDGTAEYTTNADGSGNFIQPISPALANGTVVSVRARDAAGNTSAPATVTVGGVIGSLDCSSPSYQGILYSNMMTSAASFSVSYTGGNGGTHNGQTVGSTGINGLTATLGAGSFVNGSGSLTYTITGIPEGAGTASFSLNIGGRNCIINLTVQDPTTLPIGAGSFNGRTCFDIARSNDNVSGCASLSVRSAQQANFTQAATYTQTYTFTPTGTVSNVRFAYVNTNGQVITTVSGGNSGNNVSTPVTATVNYNTNLNNLALGLTSSNQLTALIIVIYNDGLSNNGIDRILTIKTQVKDCLCCGAYVAAGVWKQYMCHNLGANQNADPLTPSWELIGNYYQWGRNTNITSGSPRYGAPGPIDGTATGTNEGAITGWSNTAAASNAWVDGYKTINDPCPSGYRVPTNAQLVSLRNATLNTLTFIGTWASSSTNYNTGLKVGQSIFLPAAGRRGTGGSLNSRGSYGYYWSSTLSGGNAQGLTFYTPSGTGTYSTTLVTGQSIRCIEE